MPQVTQDKGSEFQPLDSAEDKGQPGLRVDGFSLYFSSYCKMLTIIKRTALPPLVGVLGSTFVRGGGDGKVKQRAKLQLGLV